jgi:hypothetical protein
MDRSTEDIASTALRLIVDPLSRPFAIVAFLLLIAVHSQFGRCM